MFKIMSRKTLEIHVMGTNKISHHLEEARKMSWMEQEKPLSQE